MQPYLKTDGSGYGKLDRGNGGGKPTFSDGQRRGFVNRSDRCDHPDRPGQDSRSGWSAWTGGRDASPPSRRRPQTRTGIGSKDGRGDRLPIVLRHDHDPQRLDTSAAPAKIGSIIGLTSPRSDPLAPTPSPRHPAIDAAVHPGLHADPCHRARPSPTPCRRRLPCQRSRHRAIAHCDAPSGLGHRAIHAEAAVQRRAGQPTNRSA